MLLDKYGPKSTKQIIGNAEQIRSLANFLKNWNQKKQAALLISGPPGCGKTLSVNLVAKEMGFELIESHASDERNKESLESLVLASKQAGILSKKKIILVEDAELIESKSTLARLIHESMHPVIIVAESPHGLNLPAVLRLCQIVKFRKVDDKLLFRFLKDACAKEKIMLADKTVEQIVASSNGDVRAALIDLEIGHALREKGSDTFEILKAVFRDSKNVRRMLDYSSLENLLAWVDENVTTEFKTPEEISQAYECLSKIDVFRARIIRRQSWGLQKYVPHVLAGMPQSKRKLSAVYKPPSRTRSVNRQTLDKIGAKLHISRKEAARFLPLMNLLIDDALSKEFDFDEDDKENIRAFRQ